MAISVVGLIMLMRTAGKRAFATMLALIAAIMLLLYMAYYWAPQGNGMATMRFLVPTFPIYILGTLFALAQIPRARITVAVSVIALQLLWGTRDLVQQTAQLHHAKESLAIVTDELHNIAHRDDVVIGDNGLLQHLDFVREYKLADISLLRTGAGIVGGMMARANGDNPSPMQSEKMALRRQKYTGLFGSGRRKFVSDVQKWSDGHAVYFVGLERDMSNFDDTRKMHVIKRIALPQMPQDTSRRTGGPFGRGGPGFFGRPGGAGPPGIMGGFGDAREVVIAQWKP